MRVHDDSLRGCFPSMAGTCKLVHAGGSWNGVGLVIGLLLMLANVLVSGAAPPPHTKEFSITVNATALNPPTWWHVPGVTPMIMTMDPETTEALRTTESRELKLKPGTYRFGTFTFDFPFIVTLDGVLDFAPSLDQCVSGRGTQTLTIRCSQMQPYVGPPDY
ncbi:MAG TPA: hypothetical protein VFL31_01225 [Nitrospiraceae bacterium]|nr:hypothetical protein [Nitrospiraceae bacterium]